MDAVGHPAVALTLLRLAAALLLGLPVGFCCYVGQEALVHPGFGSMVWHHPLLTIPAVFGAGTLGALASLAGFDVLRDSHALRGWIVAAACVIYLFADRERGFRR